MATDKRKPAKTTSAPAADRPVVSDNAAIIHKLLFLSRSLDTLCPFGIELDGEPIREILNCAAAAIADLSTSWIPTSGLGAATPALDKHYDDPDDPDMSYDYSRRVLGRESCDSPVKIVVYLRDSKGVTSWCSDTDETLSIAQWAPLPL